MWILALFCMCAVSQHFLEAARSAEELFSEIYDSQIWGVNADGGLSGEGSSLDNSEEYRNFLEHLLHSLKIRSVIDAGCGDWIVSCEIDWEGIEYTGYDVVPFLIEKNTLKYGSEHISFVHADLLAADLPPADLLICKDVLQHLSNQDVHDFIQQLSKFKYCLITNDVNKNTQSSRNSDICTGGYRTLDLTRAPFFVKARKVLTYASGSGLKQILLIEREEGAHKRLFLDF